MVIAMRDKAASGVEVMENNVMAARLSFSLSPRRRVRDTMQPIVSTQLRVYMKQIISILK
jgi:hypothetical protein